MSAAAWFCFLCGVQKLYTVCDVAMHIIMSKSTTYSLESPKDPVLPSRFFTKPDKVGFFGCFFFFFFSFKHFEKEFPPFMLQSGGYYILTRHPGVDLQLA